MSIDIGGGTIDTVINLMKKEGDALWHFSNVGLGGLQVGAGTLVPTLKPAFGVDHNNINLIEYRIRTGLLKQFESVGPADLDAEDNAMEALRMIGRGGSTEAT